MADALPIEGYRHLVRPAPHHTILIMARRLATTGALSSRRLDKLAAALTEMGHAISPNSVRKLLTELGFSRQANRKSEEGAHHPDRNAQFEYINAEVLAAQASGQPVISVDTKKKELIGNFRNGGTDYRRKGDPQRVNVHDFADKDLGKVAPYGVYDITANNGWVSVGITHDTAQFAVSAIRSWLAIRPARRNGIGSSTACSVTLRRTGGAGRSPIAWPSSS